MNNFQTQRAMAKEIFGEAYVREFDLTIAANAMESLRTGQTLYNVDINRRVSSRCMPIDAGLKPEYLGVIHVPPNEENPWLREETVLREHLAGKPRGTWAILERDGKFDSFMSDGLGGIGTDSGHKFLYSSPKAPNLNDFEALYGTVISYAIYARRNEIEAIILRHSVEKATPEIGAIARDQYINGNKYNRVILKEVLRTDAGDFVHAVVEATRRGVPRKGFQLSTSSVFRTFGVPLDMPREFVDDANASRLKALSELRYEAGQKAWTELPRESRPNGISIYESAAQFRTVDADTVVRYLWGHPEDRKSGEDGRIGEFKVTFEPGTANVETAEAYLFDDAAARPRM